MKIIYEPKGRAREYSPLAANYYNGCDHRCTYCYVPSIKKQTHKQYGSNVSLRKDVFLGLNKDLIGGVNKQVLLSFAGDPYCAADVEIKATRKILEMFLNYKVPTAVLSKGGIRMLRDIDVMLKFGPNIKVGATLVFGDGADRRDQEPGAASTHERMETLEVLHKAGIRTWASMEPVINPEHSLRIIRDSVDYIDEYKLGKVNHLPLAEKGIDWRLYLTEALAILRPRNKMIYVKHDLREKCSNIDLKPQEYTLDSTALEDWMEK